MITAKKNRLAILFPLFFILLFSCSNKENYSLKLIEEKILSEFKTEFDVKSTQYQNIDGSIDSIKVLILDSKEKYDFGDGYYSATIKFITFIDTALENGDSVDIGKYYNFFQQQGILLNDIESIYKIEEKVILFQIIKGYSRSATCGLFKRIKQTIGVRPYMVNRKNDWCSPYTNYGKPTHSWYGKKFKMKIDE